LSGIYLAPSYSNPQTWFGLIYVRYGIYSSAAYRFFIIMGDDYYDPSMMKFPIAKPDSTLNNNSSLGGSGGSRFQSKDSGSQNSSAKNNNGKPALDRTNSETSSQGAEAANSDSEAKHGQSLDEDQPQREETTSSGKKSEQPSSSSKSGPKAKENLRGSHWNLPRIYFYSPTKPYHPHVDPITGELNLSWYFKTWDEKRCHVWHCLKLLKHIFYNKLCRSDLYFSSSGDTNESSINQQHNKDLSEDKSDSKNEVDRLAKEFREGVGIYASNLFNETAAKIYQEDSAEYLKMVRHNIDKCRIELNTVPTVTDDAFEPNYSDIPEDTFNIQKNKMLCAGEKQKLTGWQAQNAQTSGHSFIQEGTIRPFSKR